MMSFRGRDYLAIAAFSFSTCSMRWRMFSRLVLVDRLHDFAPLDPAPCSVGSAKVTPLSVISFSDCAMFSTVWS